MNTNTLHNIHVGEILKEEFLIPLGISQYKLANELHIPHSRVTDIIKGKRSITPDTAMRLSIYFGNSTDFWLNLQRDYDMEDLQKKQLQQQITPLVYH